MPCRLGVFQRRCPVYVGITAAGVSLVDRRPTRWVIRTYTVDDHRRLAAVSTAQLACGIIGLVIAVRRRHAFDLPLLQGNPERVVRDAATLGTALSAPLPMLAAQALLTLRAARFDDPRAIRGLNALGLAMVAGSLGERLIRRRLRPNGWDPIETPLVAAAVGLSAAMALLGRGTRRA